MATTAALPPYGHLDETAVQCIAQAAQRYEVPELLLHAIVSKENGRTGQCVKNRNETLDCGLAQINTSWVPHFAKYGIRAEHLTHHACTNLMAAAYVLKRNYLLKDNDWFKAIVSYNIGPRQWTQERYPVGHRYALDVVQRWHQLHNYAVSWHAHRQASSQAAPTNSSATR